MEIIRLGPQQIKLFFRRTIIIPTEFIALRLSYYLKNSIGNKKRVCGIVNLSEYEKIFIRYMNLYAKLVQKDVDKNVYMWYCVYQVNWNYIFHSLDLLRLLDISIYE